MTSSTSLRPERPASRREHARPAAPTGGPHRRLPATAYVAAYVAAYVVALVALVLPRLHSGSDLWLDETLSVDIARLPLPDLFAALRHDGAPPLYYLLLHGWIRVFGTGDTAVRSLSTVCSLVALVLAHRVGRRLARAADLSPCLAWIAVLVLAASPFEIRYATEARMYALVTALSLALALAVLRALERPVVARLAPVGVGAGLLALTHYWALFLLVALEVGLLVAGLRRGRRSPAARVALAVPGGALLFGPWLPSLLFQAAHTGTPWAPPPSWDAVPYTLQSWSGPGAWGVAGAVLTTALALCGARSRDGRRLLLAGLATLGLGLLVSRVQGAGYAARYSTPALVPILLAAAIGVTRLRARWRTAALALVVAQCLTVALGTSLLGARTQADAIAAPLAAQARAGDLVVYCPDQLAPAVARLIGVAPYAQQEYPSGAGPALVDWVDYAARNAAASPMAFAAQAAAGTTGRIWLVRGDGYLTYGDQCAELDRDLAAMRPRRVLVRDADSQGRTLWLIEYQTGR